MRILMYHEVADRVPEEVHAVSVGQFGRHMGWLAAAGYRGVSLHDWLAGRKDAEPSTDEKRVVITFDDGYQDNYVHALPILLEHGFTATVFLVSGCVGGTSQWREGRLAAAPLLTWSQVREMMALGFDFGSHTVSHRRLSLLDDDSVARELSLSRDRIEVETGQSVTSMAYPYSAFTPRTKAVVSERGYQLACTYRPGYVGPAGDDPLALERIGILSSDNLEMFRQKVRGSLALRIAWYRRLLRARVRILLGAYGETG